MSDFTKILTPGQILYSVERVGLGNTTMHTTAVYRVVITKVTPDVFYASWNGNREREYYAIPSTWKKKKPYIVTNFMRSRKATREEIKSGEHIEQQDYIKVVPRG